MLKSFPDMVIRGTATSSPPRLTAEDLAAIRLRADGVNDQQIKTDLFRLLAEVARLRGPEGK